MVARLDSMYLWAMTCLAETMSRFRISVGGRHCYPPFFNLSDEGTILAPQEIWSQLNALKSSIAVRACLACLEKLSVMLPKWQRSVVG